MSVCECSGNSFHRDPTNFVNFPPEVLVKIILDLDWHTILRLKLVCSTLAAIIEEHTSIKYHVELGIAGMVDGSAPLSSATRLARLRLYQSRWKRLAPTRTQSVRCARGGIWELAGGILAQGVKGTSPTTNNNTTHDSNFRDTEVRKLLFTRLPSAARAERKTMEWAHDDYEFPIRDFTFDPSQDLLVLIRTGTTQSMDVELHFRSLLTNEKHAEAKLGVLTHQLDGGSSRYSHMMQICQDRFAILHTGTFDIWPEKLVVYNWKTGTLEFEIEFCGILSYTFLTPDHLLVAVQPFNVVPARQEDDQHRLVILDIPSTAALRPGGHPEAYVATAEFHFPDMRQYTDVEEIVVHSEPIPAADKKYTANSYGPGGHGKNKAFSPVAFETELQNRMIVITLHVRTVLDDIGDHRTSEAQTLAFFVPSSVFLPYTLPYTIKRDFPSGSNHRWDYHRLGAPSYLKLTTLEEIEQKEFEVIPANTLSEPRTAATDFTPRSPSNIAVPWGAWTRRSPSYSSLSQNIFQSNPALTSTQSPWNRFPFELYSSVQSSFKSERSDSEQSANSDEDAVSVNDFGSSEDSSMEDINYLSPISSAPSISDIGHGIRVMLVPGADDTWVCNTSGSRFVYALEPRDLAAPHAPRHIAVLDFNMDSIRYEKELDRRKAASAPSETGRLNELDSIEAQPDKERGESGPVDAVVEDHFESSTLSSECYGIFEDDIVSDLPFRKVVLREKTRCDGVLLTEDNIIIVDSSSKEYKVLTF